MFSPYWNETLADVVMNEFELHFEYASDESSTIMHRMVKAFGGYYDISHNYWRNE